MAREIYVVIRSFGRGIANLGCGWNWSDRPSRRVKRGIGRHFLRVGERMKEATVRFAEAHPEVPVHA